MKKMQSNPYPVESAASSEADHGNEIFKKSNTDRVGFNSANQLSDLMQIQTNNQI
jgi:hypothetical protein